MPVAAEVTRAAVGTEAADTARAFNNKFLPSGSKSTSQRFEPFFLGVQHSLHNLCYRKLRTQVVSDLHRFSRKPGVRANQIE
jgi:hypothetical protein